MLMKQPNQMFWCDNENLNSNQVIYVTTKKEKVPVPNKYF